LNEGKVNYGVEWRCVSVGAVQGGKGFEDRRRRGRDRERDEVVMFDCNLENKKSI
jgi:hypothetical protein